MKKDLDAKQILEKLSELRVFDGEKSEFWSLYLEYISYLVKSSFIILISKKNETWSFEEEFIQEEYKDLKDEVLSLSLNSANRAISNIFAYERFNDKTLKLTNSFIVSINLNDIEQDKKYSLVMLLENNDKIGFSNYILRAALCRDIPFSYARFNNQVLNSKSLEQIDEIDEQLSEVYFKQVLVLLNTINDVKEFKLACMKIVDELSNQFDCNKVSIGWEKNDYIKPVAISRVEHFQNSSNEVKALEALFEESYEQDEEIFYPLDEDSTLITHAHKTYLMDYKLNSVYTFPIRNEEKILGVVSFEYKESTLSSKEFETIILSLNYISSFLKNIYDNDKNFFQKTFSNIKESSSGILGAKNTLKKLLVIFISFICAFIVFGKMEYKVESVITIQTDNIAYLSAPFDGIIKNVNIDAGDNIKKGQKLVEFDIQELSLKELEVNSDIIKFSTEVEKARSNRSLADMKISLAKKEQAEVMLQKTQYFLNQSVLKAPFDGIIVEGDKEKLLGSPFSKGDKILQIANPTELYGKIKVLEEYIDEIKIGQIAEINLLSRPDEYFDVKIDKIIPIANVDDVNGNVFVLKVVFIDDVKDWMRPGMSGVAKIKIEDRPILWILTHKISDYLYLHFWW
ncbi:MAG: hypothetical protein CL624_13010 [Arcobacter sp.]|nr:hypothetical protein [Arcobacter sp.]|tara:strand:- start:344 stop:2224 length:1881 start_codon:yes stop_codon:yes gene_type:complete